MTESVEDILETPEVTETTETIEITGPSETTEASEEITVNSESDPNSESDDAKWTEGEMLTFLRVRFPGNARSFPFIVSKKNFSYGQKVLAMSDRGMDVGYINSFPYKVAFSKSMLPIRSISKVATEADIAQQRENILKEKEAEVACLDIVENLKLDMTITHVEIIQFGKKLVFYFTAPARVDFRELVKQLVSKLKMRIELRQISVRDRAAALGSIASCGLPTCCSSFLQSYGNVSVKMAKNQNLALIPSKINGVCGQIKCCIKYENHVYSEKRKKLPPESLFMTAANGDKGKVTKLHLFVEQFDMLTIDGKIKRYCANQFDGKTEPQTWEFPRRFDNITNETQHVIGLELIDPTPVISQKDNILHQAKEELEANSESASSESREKEKENEEKGPRKKPQHNKNRNRNNNNRNRKPNREKSDNSDRSNRNQQDKKPDSSK